MKLIDILDNLDKSEANQQYVDVEDMLYEVNLSCYGVSQPSENPKLVSYWLGNHYCTDTYVGVLAYYLEGTLVAISTQTGRKSGLMFEWVSGYHAKLVRDYILSLVEEEEDELQVTLIDPNEDMGEGYPVQYVGQLLTKDVLYQGCMVAVVKEDSQGYKNFHTITIEYRDGTQEDVDIRDTLCPWKTK